MLPDSALLSSTTTTMLCRPFTFSCNCSTSACISFSNTRTHTRITIRLHSNADRHPNSTDIPTTAFTLSYHPAKYWYVPQTKRSRLSINFQWPLVNNISSRLFHVFSCTVFSVLWFMFFLFNSNCLFKSAFNCSYTSVQSINQSINQFLEWPK